MAVDTVRVSAYNIDGTDSTEKVTLKFKAINSGTSVPFTVLGGSLEVVDTNATVSTETFTTPSVTVAKITGKNLSTVSNIMRLLKLQDKILEYILQGKLVEGQARALLAVKDEEKQLEIADKIIEKNLTVRDVERLIYGDKEYNRKIVKKEPKAVYYEKLENRLKDYFGYKVKLDQTKKHQRLIIEYNDEDGLESLLSMLNIKM